MRVDRAGDLPDIPVTLGEQRHVYGMSTPTLLRRLLGPARAIGGRITDGELRPGVTFRNAADEGIVEVAHVLDVRRDRFNIVHVRFDLVRRYQGMTAEAGERTLAAPAFRKRFPQRLETPES